MVKIWVQDIKHHLLSSDNRDPLSLSRERKREATGAALKNDHVRPRDQSIANHEQRQHSNSKKSADASASNLLKMVAKLGDTHEI
jgi:hypothetical protein